MYDLDRYRRVGQPPFAATLARETHFEPARDGQTKIQLSFSFSDGFGREIQKKIQAEPGKARKRQVPVALPSGDIEPGKLQPGEADAARRWVGSGRTVFNNKGKPVKQYEPFFSATHLYESESEVTDTGVSPVLFYDPVERVVATLHPNHTYEKVVFDPWQQTTFDVNDTVIGALGQQPFATRDQTGDPRTDPDIKGYVREYFKTQPNWETWHAQRIGNAMGTAERDAARKAEAHANTPATAHLDVLGRVFITLAHNKVVCPGHALDGTVDRFATRVDLDIEGNQRAVRDAIKKAVDPQGNAIVDELGRMVMRYDYDLLGNRIHQASMEAGERWMLSDAVGRPIRAWDSRFFLRRMTYDELRRPTGLFVIENGAERLAERTVYGEGQGDAANHRGQIFQRYDGAGVVTNVAYDFKGNLREHKRELLPTYKVAVNWSQNPTATDGTFTSSTTFDALNRPLTVTSPDGSVYRPTFNEANLLDKVEVELRGVGAATAFVTNIDYNAKGQREQIDYKNGATTTYEYDQFTFRLLRQKTTRPANADATASQLFNDASVVQDLRYSYDPVGNITRIEDVALKTVIRNGQSVEPVGAYTYDAIYRLIEAVGREHIGQNAFDFNPPNGDYRDYPFVGRAHPNDLQALRNYTERYQYDPVGNFEELAHRFNGAGWTRSYEYQENSLLEAGKKSNRLTSTTVGNGLNQVEPYTHDAHGNMTSMPHLATMVWDFKDQLQQADLGGGGTAYYVYDGAGQRVRKVIESHNGARQRERLYLGGFEIYREYNGVGISLERESLHVLDDKQRIALVETQTIQNGNAVNGPVPLQRYQLGNHLGSSSVELDKDGALIAYEEYHPYGTMSFQAGRSAAEVSLKRYRYTGKERDDETSLNYHSARYFAPWLGRWTSADPLMLVDGPNLYRYARNAPLLLTDPQGTDPPLVNTGNPNDPRNYVSFEDFQSGAVGPWSDEGLRTAWSEAHTSLTEVRVAPTNEEWDPWTQTAGSGAVTIYNTAQRVDYLAQVRANSAEGVQRIQAAREAGDIAAAEAAARETSATRNALRTATQERLTPGSRYMSEVLEEARDFESLAHRYAQPNQFDTFEEVARAAGRSRGSVTTLTRVGKVAGPLGVAVGVGVGVYEVAEAPPAERPRVAAREGGGVLGGVAGAELGVAAGTGGAALIAGALGLSGPPGWLVLGLGILGGIGGGYLGSEGGRAGGEAVYDAATSAETQGLNDYYSDPYVIMGMGGP